MKIEEYDVYVSENALVEVTRGEHLTVCQAFGEDWHSMPNVMIHSQTMIPPTNEPSMLELAAIEGQRQAIEQQQKRSKDSRAFWAVAIGIATALGFLLISIFKSY